MSPSDGDQRDPSAIGQVLDRVLDGLGASRGRRSAGLFEAWDRVVGHDVATHARPLALTQGLLRVGVEDPLWATELRYRKPELLAALETELGAGAVTGIEIVVRL